MVEITHREKTEEEIKAIEEARKTHGKWMGEERVADIKPAEPADGERVNLKINQIPAITFLEGNLPRSMLDELNAHVDEHRARWKITLVISLVKSNKLKSHNNYL